MSSSVPQIYQGRSPQSTLLYQIVQNYFEGWLVNYVIKHNEIFLIATAMHMVEAILPKLPLRQWVLSVPKWLRYYLARDAGLASHVLRIFIDEIKKRLHILSAKIKIDAKIGAISFIQRFGSSLNLHLHYHCVVIDGIFYQDACSELQFNEVNDLGVDDTEAVQPRVRHRVLSLFKRKGILTEDEVLNLRSWKGNADTDTIIMACWRQVQAIATE